MRAIQLTAGVIVASLSLAFSGASAQPQHVDPAIAETFAAKCATCHDPAVGRAPSRDELARRAPDAVVQALTRGSMSAMGADLTPQKIRDLAVYVTGKPLDAPTGAAAASLSASSQPADPMCPANSAIRITAGDWNGFGKDLGASRLQPVTAIKAANVDRLKVKWAFSLAGGRAGQPTVIGDHLFLVTFAGDAYSLVQRPAASTGATRSAGPRASLPLLSDGAASGSSMSATTIATSMRWTP